MKKNENTFTYQVTITIDPEAWALEYGLASAEDARKDAKSYLPDLLDAGMSSMEIRQGWGIIKSVVTKEI